MIVHHTWHCGYFTRVLLLLRDGSFGTILTDFIFLTRSRAATRAQATSAHAGRTYASVLRRPYIYWTADCGFGAYIKRCLGITPPGRT